MKNVFSRGKGEIGRMKERLGAVGFME